MTTIKKYAISSSGVTTIDVTRSARPRGVAFQSPGKLWVVFEETVGEQATETYEFLAVREGDEFDAKGKGFFASDITGDNVVAVYS